MITVSREPFSVVEDNKHLIEEHWNEVSAGKSARKLEPDWDTFHLCDQNGHLVTVVARDNGEVAGYAVFMIHNDMHAKSTLCAHNDALFLRKESRKGRAGTLLIKESKRILEEIYGRIMIFWHVKPDVDFSGILDRLGYVQFETIYAVLAGD